MRPIEVLDVARPAWETEDVAMLRDMALRFFENEVMPRYDDFEKAALHGTFVVDRQGRIRWQDISYEPFMDTDFMRKEAQRLLDQDKTLRKSDAPALTQQTLSR